VKARIDAFDSEMKASDWSKLSEIDGARASGTPGGSVTDIKLLSSPKPPLAVTGLQG